MSTPHPTGRPRSITFTDGPPPPAVMTCAGCGTTDINETWFTLTRNPGAIGPDDIGVCPACMGDTFGYGIFDDIELRGSALTIGRTRERDHQIPGRVRSAITGLPNRRAA